MPASAPRPSAYVRRVPPEIPPSRPKGVPGPARRRPDRRVFLIRRLVALAVMVLLIGGIASMCAGGPGDTSPQPPAPVTQSLPATPAPSAGPSIAPPSNTSIDVSRPVQLAVPSLGLDAGVEDADCRVKGDVIDPATLREACAYTAPDRPYSLPGSDARDVVVIAGHTGAGVPAVFNSLYDGRTNRHTVSVGDVLYVRTKASGSDWLAYRATDLHEPRKEGLAGSAEIWGSGPTPGRLLTISCIQPANPLADSVQNAVVGWKFDRVVSGEQVAVNMGW